MRKIYIAALVLTVVACENFEEQYIQTQEELAAEQAVTASLRSDITSLEDDINQLNFNTDYLEAQILVVEESLDVAIQQRDSLTTLSSNLQAALDASEVVNESLMADLNAANEEIARQSTVIQDLADLLHTTRVALESAKASRASMQVVINELTAEIASLSSQLSAAPSSSQISNLNAQISSLQNQVAALSANNQNATIQALQAQVASLQSSLNAANAALSASGNIFNPTGAPAWVVTRYPIVAAQPNNLENYRGVWLAEANRVNYTSALATQLGISLAGVAKFFRGVYGSRFDTKFDGAGNDYGAWAWYGTLDYHGIQAIHNHTSPYHERAAYYVHPNYARIGSASVLYMLYVNIHEMGHAYFNYQHPTSGGNVIAGFDGHKDIMGYSNFSNITEAQWNAALARYFDASTQNQRQHGTSARNAEPEGVGCILENN